MPLALDATSRRWAKLALITVVWMGVPAARLGAAEPSEPAVMLLEIQGKVEVFRAGRRFPASPNLRLISGDQLLTDVNSRGTLLWYDRTLVRSSELSVIEIPPPPAPQKRSVLRLLRGLIYFFHRDEPGRFELQTPTTVAVVVGTEFSVNVEEVDGRTTLQLFHGQVELSDEAGRQLQLYSGERGIVLPGLPPAKTPMLEADNDLIQWFLYYPAVLDPEELALSPGEQQALGASLAAYRSGDLLQALARYPPDRLAVSDGESLYLAALLLTVGQVDRAKARLAALTPGAERSASLALALGKLVAAVKNQPDASTLDPSLASGLMAESYYAQGLADLDQALLAARGAVRQSPQFGFAWARVAELEFSFGRTKPALEAVEQALRLAPRHAQALALKGFLLAARNRVAEAADFFERAIQADGALAEAWLGRGLCQIRRGQVEAGSRSLQIAAALEPQRALLRSYLGKALGEIGDNPRAFQELAIARQLDPKDPTAWLYSALIEQQENRINQAVLDLEQSQARNDNRQIYRSRLLLDQDRAVRGANLASVYQDAGMTDLSVREAARAVNTDYANFSAHLFLANSFDALRDPNQVNLRYETPWLSEYLLANLLAPVGAGTLSPYLSQQEYGRLFERDRFGLSSSTEYRSSGDWTQIASQYGVFGNSSYGVDVDYRWRNGYRANNDAELLSVFVRWKEQLTAQDSVFLQGIYYDAEAGDLAQYYDPGRAYTELRVEEKQEPMLFGGYHRLWSPESHTLLLGGRLPATVDIDNPLHEVFFLRRHPITKAVTGVALPIAPLDYRSEAEIYTAEGQQIWSARSHTFILGARWQGGDFDTKSRLGASTLIQFNTNTLPQASPAVTSSFRTDFQRWSLYGYHNWQIAEPLLLSAGLSYDSVRYPANFRIPPVSGEEDSADQLSPKAGLIWTPAPNTTVRGAYTRSLGGVSYDQSFRLEPSQVGGFNQAYRSLIPESVAGALSVPELETFGLSFEQKFGSRTYLGVQAELLRSEADNFVGAVDVFVLPGTETNRVSSPRQALDYEELDLVVSLNQLVGERWSLGARYRLSDADLRGDFVEIPVSVSAAAHRHLEALLHQLYLDARFQDDSGFFGQFESIWSAQDNRADLGDLPGEDFWQFNLWAGYRFARRRAELRLGLLNLTDRDYTLHPLNLTAELPRERTIAVNFKFTF